MPSAGLRHSCLLLSDGSAVACGENEYGECSIPVIAEKNVWYTQCSAGTGHTALLRSDGTAVACGENDYGQCDIPVLDEGVTYTYVSAGGDCTILLRSDGQAILVGYTGPADAEVYYSIPVLEERAMYTQASEAAHAENSSRTRPPHDRKLSQAVLQSAVAHGAPLREGDGTKSHRFGRSGSRVVGVHIPESYVAHRGKGKNVLGVAFMHARTRLRSERAR